MFSRKKKLTNNLPAVSSAPSIIVSDLNISGDLVSQGSIEIGGNVNGNIKCNNVIIRKESKVKGDIFADNLTINGTVIGTLNADNIFINESADFEGKVNYINLTTEPGANINGVFQKNNKDSSKIIFDNDQKIKEENSKGSIAEDDNGEEKLDVEYIPSISSLMDSQNINDNKVTKETVSQVSDSNKSENLENSSIFEFEKDKTDNELDKSLINDEVKSVVEKKQKKKTKSSKKSSILSDDYEIFDFSPPEKRKKKK